MRRQSFEVLHLFPEFFDLRLHFQSQPRHFQSFGLRPGHFGKQRVGFALHFLEQEIQFLADFRGAVENSLKLAACDRGARQNSSLSSAAIRGNCCLLREACGILSAPSVNSFKRVSSRRTTNGRARCAKVTILSVNSSIAAQMLAQFERQRAAFRFSHLVQIAPWPDSGSGRPTIQTLPSALAEAPPEKARPETAEFPPNPGLSESEIPVANFHFTQISRGKIAVHAKRAGGGNIEMQSQLHVSAQNAFAHHAAKQRLQRFKTQRQMQPQVQKTMVHAAKERRRDQSSCSARDWAKPVMDRGYCALPSRAVSGRRANSLSSNCSS